MDMLRRLINCGFIIIIIILIYCGVISMFIKRRRMVLYRFLTISKLRTRVAVSRNCCIMNSAIEQPFQANLKSNYL